MDVGIGFGIASLTNGLIGVALIGIVFIGVALIGVALIGVAFILVHDIYIGCIVFDL
jgi:hypothetical protein